MSHSRTTYSETLSLEEIEATKASQAKKRTMRWMSFVRVLENLDISLIFTFFTRLSWQIVLETTAKFFLFSFAAIASVFMSIATWRQFYKEDRFSHRLWIHATVETAAALAILTAVVGGLAFASVFGLASPYIFAIVMGAKAAYHSVAGLIELGIGLFSKTPTARREAFSRALDHGVGALVNSFGAVAVTFVMILAKPAYAPFAIVGCAIGAVYNVFKMVQAHRELKKAKQVGVAEELKDEPRPGKKHDVEVQEKPNLTSEAMVQQELRENFQRTDPVQTVIPAIPQPVSLYDSGYQAELIETVKLADKLPLFKPPVMAVKLDDEVFENEIARSVTCSA